MSEKVSSLMKDKPEQTQQISSKPNSMLYFSEDSNDDYEEGKEEEKQESDSSKKSVEQLLANYQISKAKQVINKEIVDFYVFEEKIGEGSFGKVYRAKHIETQKSFAVKELYKKKMANKKQLIAEIENLKEIDHPNIIKLYEYYETNSRIFLVLELLHGEQLYQRIEKKDELDELKVCNIFKQIMQAISFIHQKGISHRDIKPENFVFEDPINDNVKLIDFGLSSTMIPKESELTKQQTKSYKGSAAKQAYQNMSSIVGTVWYIAPEVYSKQYTELCDIWSAGVMLYIMLCGYPPFFGESQQEIKKKVLQGKLEFENEYWEDRSIQVKDLISKMLTKASNRLNAQEVLAQPWFTLDNQSKVDLSSRTLIRMKQYTHTNNLKKSILAFIAHRCSSREEISKQKKIFLQIDTKKNGFITQEEINQLLSPHLDEEQIQKVYHSIDVDNDGKIYWSQFLAATISQAIYLKDENLKEAFNYFDQERKGFFDLSDLQAQIEIETGMYTSNEDYQIIFNEAFPDGQKRICFQDFKQMMERLAY